MPVTFDSNIERKEGLYEAFPQEITVRPELNGRHEKPDIEWLVTDILANGQLEPVGVWKDGETAILAYGFSRWRAVSEINRRKLTPNPLKIKFTYHKCNEQGAFIRNISENRMRNPVTAIDDAHNIDKLIEAWQMDEKDVAKIYFPTSATEEEIKTAIKWVRERLNLIKLTPEAEKAMVAGRLSETAAQAISKLSSAQQREALKKTDGKLTAKDIKGGKPKRAKKPAPIDPELRRRITAVTESRCAGINNGFVQVDEDDLDNLESYVNEK